MDELRRALESYKDDPVNVNDKPSSWRKLDDLIDACDAALAARSEPGAEGLREAAFGLVRALRDGDDRPDPDPDPAP